MLHLCQRELFFLAQKRGQPCKGFLAFLWKRESTSNQKDLSSSSPSWMVVVFSHALHRPVNLVCRRHMGISPPLDTSWYSLRLPQTHVTTVWESHRGISPPLSSSRGWEKTSRRQRWPFLYCLTPHNIRKSWVTAASSPPMPSPNWWPGLVWGRQGGDFPNAGALPCLPVRERQFQAGKPVYSPSHQDSQKFVKLEKSLAN